MTKLTKRRPPWEVMAEVWDRGKRPIVVQVDALGVTVRQKGRRARYSVPWVSIYQLGARMEAAALAKAKREARAAKKRSEA